MIGPAEARRIAEDFLKLHAGAFRYKHLQTNDLPFEWAVVFTVHPPEGGELDGPVVVRVHRVTGVPRLIVVG